MSQVVIAMATISLVGITAVLVTPLGFPFTADKVTSSQQRAMFLVSIFVNLSYLVFFN